MTSGNTLTEQIEKLEELQKEVQRLRAIPIGLLQTGVTRKRESAADGLKAVRQIGESGLSSDIQGALQRAKESLDSDGTDLSWTGRREKRKKRRSPAASPEVFLGKDRAAPASILRPLAEEGVKMEGLGAWAREFNRTHSSKLRIRDGMLRLVMADVMTAYMGFAVGEEGLVIVETIRVFGPRETGGDGQSGYTVFQQISQQLGKVLEVEGRVKLQRIVELVAAYSSVFITACRECGRVVSGDGHVPAVVRRWADGDWIGEHVSCAAG